MCATLCAAPPWGASAASRCALRADCPPLTAATAVPPRRGSDETATFSAAPPAAAAGAPCPAS
eukprot:scaffold30129_cov35-Phaeocystis_antarctica.AAC.2